MIACVSGSESESAIFYRLQLRLRPKRSAPTDSNSGLDSDSAGQVLTILIAIQVCGWVIREIQDYVNHLAQNQCLACFITTKAAETFRNIPQCFGRILGLQIWQPARLFENVYVGTRELLWSWGGGASFFVRAFAKIETPKISQHWIAESYVGSYSQLIGSQWLMRVALCNCIHRQINLLEQHRVSTSAICMRYAYAAYAFVSGQI